MLNMVFVLGVLVVGYSVSFYHCCSSQQSSPVVNADCIKGSLTDADSVDRQIQKDKNVCLRFRFGGEKKNEMRALILMI